MTQVGRIFASDRIVAEVASRDVMLDGGRMGPPEREILTHVRILLVDDEDDSREIVRMILEAAGAEVVEASSVFEAMGLLRTSRIDVLVSDIGMPLRDGYAFIRGVRANTEHESLPAVALTAFTREEDRSRALSAGFNVHMAKPVDARGLITAIASLTRSSLTSAQ